METNIISVKNIIDLFNESLKSQYDPSEIKQFIYLLFNSVKGWDRASIYLNMQHLLKEAEVKKFHQSLEELQTFKPIQYIIGETRFRSLILKVDHSVLIPRPETEELVEYVISYLQMIKRDNCSVLDIGTGSGCIALSLKKEFPELAVEATDNSDAALKMASQNASINHCNIRLINSDIFNIREWAQFPLYRLIISNPPYVSTSDKQWMKPNVVNHEPQQALFVPDEDPLKFYQTIADFADKHLEIPGCIFFEVNERFGNEVYSLLSGKGFVNVELIKDLPGKDRFARAEKLV